LRNNLWKPTKIYPDDDILRKNYNDMKMKVKCMIKSRKRNYYVSLFYSCNKNPKKTWELGNSLSLNKTKDSCTPPKLISDSGPVTRGNKVCEIFNDFFVSVRTKLAGEIPYIYHENIDNMHMHFYAVVVGAPLVC
jgi:hypothetical protein